MENTYLSHHGIKGQRWGVRRFQNPDGSLTPRGRIYYQKKDDKWVKKQSDKIYERSLKKSKKEMDKFVKKEMQGMKGATAINTFNRKLVDVMRTKTSNIRSPSGKVIEWVAKRGQVGVFMALADQSYNMEQLKNGVWASGRVGYKQDKVDMQKE